MGADGLARAAGWNAGALLYLTLAWQMVRDAARAHAPRALEQDEGR
jgi:hypothetical protein